MCIVNMMEEWCFMLFLLVNNKKTKNGVKLIYMSGLCLVVIKNVIHLQMAVYSITTTTTTTHFSSWVILEIVLFKHHFHGLRSTKTCTPCLVCVRVRRGGDGNSQNSFEYTKNDVRRTDCAKIKTQPDVITPFLRVNTITLIFSGFKL